MGFEPGLHRGGVPALLAQGADFARPHLFVARAGEEPRRIELDLGESKGCWLDDERILVASHARRRRAIIDTRTGDVAAYDGLPTGLFPLLDVTGRFTVDQFDPVPPKAPRRT